MLTRRSISLSFTCFLLFFSVNLVSFASESIISPFNKVAAPPNVVQDYEFIVTGHLHGASSNISGFPASSLLGNMDKINSINPAFIISLGDLFLEVDQRIIQNYTTSFFNKLKAPLFNAVGNHDLMGGLYEKQFGPTYYAFNLGSELFIILDTELSDGKIQTEQLEFFKLTLGKYTSESTIKNIFIFTHRPIWKEKYVEYKDLFQGSTESVVGSSNFASEISPLLAKLGISKNIFWMSGSLGGLAPSSFFYDKKDNITFMATSIRDLPRDAMLKVKVSKGLVSFQGISLNNSNLLPIEKYNLEFWRKEDNAQPFNYRLIPYMAIKMIKHYYFWIGLAFGILTSLLLIFLKRR